VDAGAVGHEKIPIAREMIAAGNRLCGVPRAAEQFLAMTKVFSARRNFAIPTPSAQLAYGRYFDSNQDGAWRD
jgi:hypothetical protein